MAAPTYRLEGRTVLVTGAARGIGAECSRRLAARGAKVALVGLEPEELERVAGSCGPDAVWFEADVTDRAALDRTVEGAVERLGGIDVVIANAGIGAGGMVRSMDPDSWERVIEINLLGVWRTVRACLPHVIERRGYVLPVASVAAMVQLPGLSAYGASKAGVEAFANSLRVEVAHLGVGVGVAYFSWIATDMVAGRDEHPMGVHLRERLRGPFAKTYPLSTAADAVVHGIERRARWVVAPGWVRPLLLARGLIAPVAERDWLKAMPEVDRLAAEDVERRGAAASAPMGAGGEAATAAPKATSRS